MQLLAAHGPRALLDAMERREHIVYRENGSRARTPEAFLAELLPVVPRVGIRRVFRLPSLLSDAFFVYQGVRDDLLFHPVTGQSAHSEGKGKSRAQAMVSCLMEGVEKFCAEPRSPALVRGSFAQLSAVHRVVDPNALVHSDGAGEIAPDTALVWTPAADLRAGTEVLVPAESAFFPFGTKTYDTPSLFPTGTNGLASGATMLEAVVHAITELVERMYTHRLEQGDAKVECLFESECADPAVAAIAARDDVELQLHCVRLGADTRDLAMIVAFLVGERTAFMGRACGLDVDDAIVRAVSEAVQGHAVTMCGSRDHLVRATPGPAGPPPPAEPDWDLPEYRTLSIADHRKRVIAHDVDDLHAELELLLGWLADAGYPRVLAVNLTRAGIDIPVVKVIVPGLPMNRVLRGHAGAGWDHVMVERIKYGVPR
jgi:ribosomal protein S12 methylthiotransferase accessory factor YcaO